MMYGEMERGTLERGMVNGELLSVAQILSLAPASDETVCTRRQVTKAFKEIHEHPSSPTE